MSIRSGIPDIALILRCRLEAEGVKIFTGTKALKATVVNGSVLLRVGPAKGEGEPWTVEGGVLLVAAGRKPNVEGLELPAAGVAFSPRGVPADARMRHAAGAVVIGGSRSCGEMPPTIGAGRSSPIMRSIIRKTCRGWPSWRPSCGR